ncbi:hypothetical protein AB0C27_51070 [Nonomuraea sp. NPDC048882]|uniref:hypothetical protein n=1 Tax=unclassified Nonomuraea TaxID=2593643 RepID=UPI003403EBA1
MTVVVALASPEGRTLLPSEGSALLPSAGSEDEGEGVPVRRPGEEDGDGEDETTIGPPRSGPTSAARTSCIDMNPAAATPRPSRITAPRCFMSMTLSSFEETTLRHR